MKEFQGIFLPDSDTHFTDHLARGPLFKAKGTYQQAKIELALSVNPRRRGLAVDVGGHVGLWSRVLAVYFAEVVAFEPVAELVECFKLNAPGVTLHSVALGADPGAAAFVTESGNTGNSRMAARGDGATKLSCVPVRMLDEYGFQNLDFLKIDTEGYEKFVLEGGKETIIRCKPVIVVEQKPGNAERYGIGQTDAVNLLRSWDAEVVWQKSGDYCLRWTK